MLDETPSQALAWLCSDASNAASRFPCRELAGFSILLRYGFRHGFMSYYRDVYLHSPDWKNLRLQTLFHRRFTCEICGVANCELDVHHLEYLHLYDVKIKHLRAICRTCHDNVHRLMVKYPKLKTLPQHKQWIVVLSHLNPDSKWYKNEMRREKLRAFARTPLGRAQIRFSRCRNVLVAMRIVKRDRLKWTDHCLDLKRYMRCPIRFLKRYIIQTGKDPRYRADRIGPHKLLTFTPEPNLCPTCSK